MTRVPLPPRDFARRNLGTRPACKQRKLHGFGFLPKYPEADRFAGGVRDPRLEVWEPRVRVVAVGLNQFPDVLSVRVLPGCPAVLSHVLTLAQRRLGADGGECPGSPDT